MFFSGEKLASTVQGEKEDVELAVSSAREAFKSWSKLPGHARARYLYSIARHVQKHARLLAVVESLDNGKPIRETRDCDIPIVARHLYHHAGWAQLMDTEMKGRVVLRFKTFLFVWGKVAGVNGEKSDFEVNERTNKKQPLFKFNSFVRVENVSIMCLIHMPVKRHVLDLYVLLQV